MIEIFLIFLLLVISILIVFKGKEFIYYLIPFNFALDLFGNFFEKWGVLALYRALMLLILIFIILRNNFYRTFLMPVSKVIYFFLAFLLVLTIFSTDFVASFLEYLKTVIILLMFILAYLLTSEGFSLSKVLKSTRPVLYLLISNIFLSMLFSFGWAGYSRDVRFYSGSIFANVWYAPALAVVINLPLLMTKMTKMRKYLNVALVSGSFILVLLSGRRSTLLVFFIALFLYPIYFKGNFRFVKTYILLGVLLASSFPFYEDILFAQYEQRVENLGQRLERENRYQESKYLWDEVLSFENPTKSLFGQDPFLTAGKYAGGRFGNRVLHVDINIVLFSAGIIGLLLYAYIYVAIYLNFLKLKRKVLYYLKKTESNYLFFVFNVIFLSAIGLSFSGGFHAITFRSIVFIILGGIMGYLTKVVNQNRHIGSPPNVMKRDKKIVVVD